MLGTVRINLIKNPIFHSIKHPSRTFATKSKDANSPHAIRLYPLVLHLLHWLNNLERYSWKAFPLHTLDFRNICTEKLEIKTVQ